MIASLLVITGWAIVFLPHVVWRNTGFVQLNAGLTEKMERLPPAVEHSFAQALHLVPQDTPSLRGWGTGLVYQNNIGQAVKLWQSSPVMAEEALAHCLLSHTKGELALPWCRVATELNPQNADAWYLLGIAYNQNQSWSEALDAFAQASQLPNLTVSGGSGPYLKSGIIYQWGVQELDAALAAYDQAIALNQFAQEEEAAEAYYRRGEVLLWQGEAPERYAGDFVTAVTLNPTFVQARIMYAVAQYKLNSDLALAEAEIQRALEIDPGNANAYLHLGDIYALAGLPEKATEMYETAVMLAPELREAVTERQKNLQSN